MIKFKLIFFVIFSINLHAINTQISDKRLCANQNCTEPISLAKTLIRYSSPDHRILSFAPNVEVKVFSKSAGSNMELWGVEINGKRGYVNKKLIRETKILRNDFPYVVDTESVDKLDSKEVPSSSTDTKQTVGNIVPNIVQQQYEVIDGTTLFPNLEETIAPSKIENSVKPSVISQVNEPATESISSSNEESELLEVTKETEALDATGSLSDSSNIKYAETVSESTEKTETVDVGSEPETNKNHVEAIIGNVLSSVSGWMTIDKEISAGNVKSTEQSNINDLGDNDEKIDLKTNEEDDDSNEEGDDDTDEENNDDDDDDDDEETQEPLQNLQIEAKVDAIENGAQIIEDGTKNNDGLESNKMSDNADVEKNDNLESKNNVSDVESASPNIVAQEEIEEETVKTRNLLNVDDVAVSSREPNEAKAITSDDAVASNVECEATEKHQDGELSEQKTAEGDVGSNTETTEAENSNLQDNSAGNHEEIITTEQPREILDQESKDQLITTESVIYDVHDVTPNPVKQDEVTLSEDKPEISLTTETKEDYISQPSTIVTNTEDKDTDGNSVFNIDGQQASILNASDKTRDGSNDFDTPQSNASSNDNSKSGEGIGEDSVREQQLQDIGVESGDSSSSANDSGALSGIYSNLFGDAVVRQEQNEVTEEVKDNTSEEGNWTSEQEIAGAVHISEEQHSGDYESLLISKDYRAYESCSADKSDCTHNQQEPSDKELTSPVESQLDDTSEEMIAHSPDVLNLLTVLGITGISVVLFLLGYVLIDKSRKEGPLIAKINGLEKSLLVAAKENQLLTDRIAEVQEEAVEENDRISSEAYDNLRAQLEEALALRAALEEQVQGLEKELENSTEVGLELNKMLSDILSSQNGSEILIANVEQLQKQLVEQQSSLNSTNATLNLKDTENHELQLELEINNKKVTDLQAELDKMVLNIFKIEEEKEQVQSKLDSELSVAREELDKIKSASGIEQRKLLDEIKWLKNNCSELQRNLELKSNEYVLLKESVNQVKAVKNNTETLKSLLDMASVKAELQQMQRDNQAITDLLHQEQQTKHVFEKQAELAIQETQLLKVRYDEADKEKLEALTKLEVLSNYFKEREAQLQKELSKQESMWSKKQGEATSTVERIKYMQQELQNCKAQNESLKQEIVSQEVELKSQISVLEKKAHESWVTARQAERKLEDARQEAAQLRNRLTLKERSFIDDKGQKRIQSPLEQNGELPTSPLHMPVDTPASPPLLFGGRDHLTTSPPIPGLPPFLPPPPGVPFMPPPMPGVPGFMPPPPSIFSVDHRPPPLGRMSSPPINSRYSPDSRYSPYDRNSPSPPYDDDYGSSPPPLHRGYSPYNNRDYKRPPAPIRSNGRNKGAISSGSGNSNESLEKISRPHSKV